MNLSLPASSVLLSIAAVERETGLSKDILRVWERRYGFPVPARDAAGERTYGLDQVERLRIVKRLIDAGHRAGRIAALPLASLRALAESTVDHPRHSPAAALLSAEAAQLVELLRAGDVPELRHQLAHRLARHGVRGFLLEVVAPLNQAIGDAWMLGKLQIYQEHLYSELMQSMLRQALSGIPSTSGHPPRVLLTSLPGEPHGLGLLMAEAMFALEGCCCLPLGTQTPLLDIVQATQALQVDIVALGFAGCLGMRQVVGGLTELRAKLPPTVALWVGGSAPMLARRLPPGVQRVDSLSRVAAELRAAGFGAP